MNLKGIHLLNNKNACNNNGKQSDDDDDSLISSSSNIICSLRIIVEEIHDCEDIDQKEDYTSPEIIVSHHGKQITTPRIIPLVPIAAFGSTKDKESSNPGNNKAAVTKKPEPEAAAAAPPFKAWERPVTGN